jgi:hypothetical protein
MNNEIWKTIEGYEDYDVSNYGNIRSWKYTNSPRLLKPKSIGKGYLVVSLSKNAQIKQLSVHKLVGMAFINNPDNKPHINHIDEDIKNNHSDNLEWCTQQENIQKHFSLNHDITKCETCIKYQKHIANILKYPHKSDTNFATNIC